jgi:23S rRNA pseudouridine1911/1915/1917 synthase
LKTVFTLDSNKMPVKKELIAGEDAAGKRLDKYISANAGDNFSRARVQALVRTGHVFVNGKKPKGSSQRLKTGDVIEFNMPPPEPAEPIAEDISLDILYEDEHLIVINKPAGMVVHPAPGHWTGTLVNALLFHCGDSLSGIGGVKRPGIVHRLDKDTSGVMVAAKHDVAHNGLAKLFAEHDIDRSYQALTWGCPLPARGTIEGNIGRHPKNRIKMAIVAASQGRHAVTHYRVLQNFQRLAARVECRLETGRTHQIRVHLAHIGFPVIGDPLYGRGQAKRPRGLSATVAEPAEAFKRQALHANVLGFRHPISGESLKFTADLPSDMQTLVSLLSTLEN